MSHQKAWDYLIKVHIVRAFTLSKVKQHGPLSLDLPTWAIFLCIPNTSLSLFFSWCMLGDGTSQRNKSFSTERMSVVRAEISGDGGGSFLRWCKDRYSFSRLSQHCNANVFISVIARWRGKVIKPWSRWVCVLVLMLGEPHQILFTFRVPYSGSYSYSMSHAVCSVQICIIPWCHFQGEVLFE